MNNGDPRNTKMNALAGIDAHGLVLALPTATSVAMPKPRSIAKAAK